VENSISWMCMRERLQSNASQFYGRGKEYSHFWIAGDSACINGINSHFHPQHMLTSLTRLQPLANVRHVSNDNIMDILTAPRRTYTKRLGYKRCSWCVVLCKWR
jgi:hypothetical protein